MTPDLTRGPGDRHLPQRDQGAGAGAATPCPSGLDPDVGLYLLGRPPAPVTWEHRWIRWSDLGLPSDRDDAVARLVAVSRLAHDRRVEVACGGGRGRTGTGLAVMAMTCGVDPADAVGWVRAHYHRRAIETPWQRRWVESLPIA